MKALVAEHSPVGGSGAKRWMECPGSVGLIEAERIHRVGGDGGEYAAEGTAAHEMAEAALRDGKDPWELIGDRPEWTSDMAVQVQVFTDYCRSLEGVGNAEVKLQHEDIPLFRGTADYLNLGPAGVTVVDLKFGQGVLIDADTPQLKYYGYLALLSFDADLHNITAETPVNLVIVQPRRLDEDGQAIRGATMTVGELRAWGEDVLTPALLRALDDGGQTLKAGEHCQFCEAAPRCAALREVMLSGGQMARTAALQPYKERLFYLGEFLAIYELMTKVRSQIADAAHAELSAGRPVPGFKLVAGRGSRHWKEGATEQMESEFGEKAFAPAPQLTPAQLEKLPGGADFSKEWSISIPGKPRVALESERGKDITPREALADDDLQALLKRQV